jgi:hypothetical protein
MNDQLETATEDLPQELRIEATGVVAIAIISLATYGAQDLTRRGVAKANQIRINRKARKVAKQAETATPEQ